jgi:hypothetical protein
VAGKPSSLVVKLRARPDTREAGPLAGWIIRHLKAGTLKKAGKAAAASRGKGKGSLKPPKPEKKPGPAAKKPSPFDDDLDDPFNEDWGPNDPITPEDKEQARYEARQLAALEKAERSRVYGIVQEAGGLKTRDDLREEYAEIPNTFKRKDGIDGDEMADYLKTYYPEFGIEDERDLVDFLAA